MPSKERSLRAEAVVLRHSDWGETDRILTLFTRELGKVRAIAKGIRKPRSRKAGHLQPFTRSNLLLARGRDLFIITQAETVEAYLVLKEDLVLLGYAAYTVELLDRFTYEEGEHSALFRLLVNTLKRLAQHDDPDLVIHYYELRLLEQVGFRPQLFQCSQCEAEIVAEDQFFSASQGGVMCPKCGRRGNDTRQISLNALKYMRHFQRSSYAEARQARLSALVSAEIENLMQYYLTYLLERNLNTPVFLRRVRSDRRALDANNTTEE